MATELSKQVPTAGVIFRGVDRAWDRGQIYTSFALCRVQELAGAHVQYTAILSCIWDQFSCQRSHCIDAGVLPTDGLPTRVERAKKQRHRSAIHDVLMFSLQTTFAGG